MNSFRLPNNDTTRTVEKVVIRDHLVIGTTTGLLKDVNEDMIGAHVGPTSVRLCIADGHWGSDASKKICGTFLRADMPFPSSKREAARIVSRIETQLFEAFGSAHMDSTKDFTPEAAFVAAELNGTDLSVTAYGDCRMVIVRKKRIVFQLETKDTWLGAFSHLGLRTRQSARSATVSTRLSVLPGDTILLFTDGVDQCVYEKPTLSLTSIASMVGASPCALCDRLFKEVFVHGAEDNASVGILRV